MASTTSSVAAKATTMFGDIIYNPPPDVSVAPRIVKTVWTLVSFSIIVVVTRCLVKFRTTRRLYYDDGLMIFAVIFGIIHAITVTQASQYGLGRHMIYIPMDELSETFRLGFLSLAWGFLSPMAARLSFCVFILWVSGVDAKIKRWPIYFFMGLQVAVNLSQVVVAYAECGTHLSALWNVSELGSQTSYCWAPEIQSYYGYFSGAMNTITDVFLTILPAVIVQHARMSLRAKLGLIVCLCLSVLAAIASIVKTCQSRLLSLRADYSWDLVNYVIWISIELNVAIIVTSVPVLRPLFTRRGLARIVLQPLGTAQYNTGSQGGSHNSYPMSRTKGMGTRINSTSSEEEILGRQESTPSPSLAITKTIEVSVTSSKSNTTFVHAALVGLPFD